MHRAACKDWPAWGAFRGSTYSAGGTMKNLVCCDSSCRCSPYQDNNVPVSEWIRSACRTMINWAKKKNKIVIIHISFFLPLCLLLLLYRVVALLMWHVPPSVPPTLRVRSTMKWSMTSIGPKRTRLSGRVVRWVWRSTPPFDSVAFRIINQCDQCNHSQHCAFAPPPSIVIPFPLLNIPVATTTTTTTTTTSTV